MMPGLPLPIPAPDDGHQMVFVAGLHRSGTSLLHRCLSDHPSISAFHGTGVPEDEGQHLQTVMEPALAYGGPGKFGFDPRVHLTEGSLLATAEQAQTVFAEWSAHWDLSRPCLLEKSPPNLMRMRFLQALFPGAAFVVVLRHPIAVAFATQKWSRTSISDLVRHWLVCHEQFQADLPHLRRVHVLHYEDFTERPEAVLGGVTDFLGLPAAPLHRTVRTGVNDAYFSRWADMGGSVRRAVRQRLLIARYERRVRHFGYSLSSVTRRVPTTVALPS